MGDYWRLVDGQGQVQIWVLRKPYIQEASSVGKCSLGFGTHCIDLPRMSNDDMVWLN